MKRRGFLTTTSTLTILGTQVWEAINRNNSLEKIQRKDKWYGERSKNNGEYVITYDYFPNPVVKTDNGETTVEVKTKNDDDNYFEVFDREETTITIPTSEYKQKKEENAYRGTVINFHNVFNDVIQSSNYNTLVSKLIPNNVENELLAVLRFVQKTEYKKDYNSTNKFGYTRYPVETLVDGVGDCKDTTMLFIALANALGIPTGYASFIGHITPIIPKHVLSNELLPVPKATITINNTDYVILETTTSFEVGRTVQKKNELIFTYTDQITMFNIANIQTHIEQGIKKLKQENVTKKHEENK